MNALPTTEPFYVVETPTPQVWIDPDLEVFYHRAQQFLAGGARSGELSSWLGMEQELVRFNLVYLRRLRFVRLMDDRETAAIRARRREEEVFDKGTKFLSMAEALPGAGMLLASYAYYFLFW